MPKTKFEWSYDIWNELVFVHLPIRLSEQTNVLAGPKSIHYFVHFLQRGVAIKGVHLSIPHKSNTYDASCDCHETYLWHSSPGIGRDNWCSRVFSSWNHLAHRVIFFFLANRASLEKWDHKWSSDHEVVSHLCPSGDMFWIIIQKSR